MNGLAQGSAGQKGTFLCALKTILKNTFLCKKKLSERFNLKDHTKFLF